MSGQPLVSALSICGPAIGRAVSYGEIDEILDGRDEPRNAPQQKPQIRTAVPTMDAPLTSKENMFSDNNTTSAKVAHPVAAPKTTAKKTTGIAPQKPPFLVGKAPIRSNPPPIQKPQATPIGNVDNRAEIAELKRQIGELSHLLRLHVNDKVTKRDIGTDPIDFDKMTVDTATNTDSGNICSKCKQVSSSKRSPVPLSIVEEDSPQHNGSLCSQFGSMAMQYLSDDQLANIAHGNRSGEIVPRKTSSNSKKQGQQQQRRHPVPLVETSPPKRRLAAVATTTESNTISPNFGSNGGVTVTRRRVMTMEQQVSLFGCGSKAQESVPFGFSVASQEFMQRHGVGKTATSRQPPVRQAQRYFDHDDGYSNSYPRPERHRYPDYQRNHNDSLLVRPDRHHGHQQQQYQDVDAYFDDEWD